MPIPFTVALAFATAHPATPSATQNPTVPDTLAKILAATQIAVAYSTDSPPFSFNDEGNGRAAYSMALCSRVTTVTEPRPRELLGERRVDVKVALVHDGGNGIGQLQSGALDALAGDRLEANRALAQVYASARPAGLVAALYLLNAIPQ